MQPEFLNQIWFRQWLVTDEQNLSRQKLIVLIDFAGKQTNLTNISLPNIVNTTCLPPEGKHNNSSGDHLVYKFNLSCGQIPRPLRERRGTAESVCGGRDCGRHTVGTGSWDAAVDGTGVLRKMGKQF